MGNNCHNTEPSHYDLDIKLNGQYPVANGHWPWNRLIGGTDYRYFWPIFKGFLGISPENMARNVVQYLHFRYFWILKISH